MAKTTVSQLEAIALMLKGVNEMNDGNVVVATHVSLESDTGDNLGVFTMDDNAVVVFDGAVT